MTLQLPTWDGTTDGMQFIIDRIAMSFPVGPENVRDVLKLAVTGTQRKIAFGLATATFTAANTSAQVTIPHTLVNSVGVGVVPVAFFTQARQPANVVVTIQETAAPDATNFYVKAFRPDGVAITNTQAFYWAAVG